MGWTSIPGYTRADVIRERVEGRFYNPRQFRKCIAHCIKGRILWTVWEINETKDGVSKTDRYIGCDIISARKNEAGYKDLCESMHPYYYSCPLAYLDMVPVACEEWRKGVRDYHAKRAAQRSLLKVGQTVNLVKGCTVRGIPVTTATILSLRPLRAAGGGMTFKLSSRHVATV